MLGPGGLPAKGVVQPETKVWQPPQAVKVSEVGGRGWAVSHWQVQVASEPAEEAAAMPGIACLCAGGFHLEQGSLAACLLIHAQSTSAQRPQPPRLPAVSRSAWALPPSRSARCLAWPLLETAPCGCCTVASVRGTQTAR